MWQHFTSALYMQELLQKPALMQQALQALVTPEMLPSFLSAARKLPDAA